VRAVFQRRCAGRCRFSEFNRLRRVGRMGKREDEHAENKSLSCCRSCGPAACAGGAGSLVCLPGFGRTRTASVAFMALAASLRQRWKAASFEIGSERSKGRGYIHAALFHARFKFTEVQGASSVGLSHTERRCHWGAV
jgi:hypothetical protein